MTCEVKLVACLDVASNQRNFGIGKKSLTKNCIATVELLLRKAGAMLLSHLPSICLPCVSFVYDVCPSKQIIISLP